jgi:large subunit ribosomal protein L29
MKYKELKDLSAKELETKRNELLITLMKENAQVAMGTIPKNPGILKSHKKTIARIRTAERQRKEAPKQ